MAQTFNDGVVQIFSVENVATAGDMLKEQLKSQLSLRYHERTVGLNRHTKMLQAGVVVKHVLRCPRRPEVSTQHVAVPNDGRQYRIVQVQYPENVVPPSMDLTLEALDNDYEYS